MKESYVKELGAHSGPESCVVARKGRGEALTGVRAGRVLSRERNFLRGADAVRRSGRQHSAHRYREMRRGPRGQRPRACTETPRARTGRSRVRPTQVTGQAASGSLRTHADDARTREVGWPHSTCEVPEQRCQQSARPKSSDAAACGGDGEKGASLGESTCEPHPPDTVPDYPGATGSRADTAEGISGFSCCSLLHVTTRGRSRMR